MALVSEELTPPHPCHNMNTVDSPKHEWHGGYVALSDVPSQKAGIQHSRGKHGRLRGNAAYLIEFSFPPILGVTTERRRAGAAATVSTLSATRMPVKLDVAIGPVKADAHAADPTRAANVRTS